MLTLATQLSLEKVLVLVDLRGELAAGLLINKVIHHLDALLSLRLMAFNRVFDLFDDAHRASLLSGSRAHSRDLRWPPIRS